ncbi:uncharacterized protein [Macrobrachium rosenbergii]|uniref:uncharacterized protein isoform X2 n=1 Tax=Macrobrachium rosenbergii TaxID=79674 RepID=UPI0034D508A8
MPANALAKQIAKNSPLTQILMAGISTRVWTLSRHIDLSDRGNRIPSECRVAWERVFRMSDEERDIDIESDEEETCTLGPRGEIQFASQAEKRAHHNALERKRRDHIKDSFCSLRDSVPSLQGEKDSSLVVFRCFPFSPFGDMGRWQQSRLRERSALFPPKPPCSGALSTSLCQQVNCRIEQVPLRYVIAYGVSPGGR